VLTVVKRKTGVLIVQPGDMIVRITETNAVGCIGSGQPMAAMSIKAAPRQ
jgi:hypothetical protein